MNTVSLSRNTPALCVLSALSPDWLCRSLPPLANRNSLYYILFCWDLPLCLCSTCLQSGKQCPAFQRLASESLAPAYPNIALCALLPWIEPAVVFCRLKQVCHCLWPLPSSDVFWTDTLRMIASAPRQGLWSRRPQLCNCRWSRVSQIFSLNVPKFALRSEQAMQISQDERDLCAASNDSQGAEKRQSSLILWLGGTNCCLVEWSTHVELTKRLLFLEHLLAHFKGAVRHSHQNSLIPLLNPRFGTIVGINICRRAVA